jgi:hypothetical protein
MSCYVVGAEDLPVCAHSRRSFSRADGTVTVDQFIRVSENNRSVALPGDSEPGDVRARACSISANKNEVHD